MRFAENLKILRQNDGLTQEQFAEILRTSKSNISKYEDGSVEPNLEKIVKIAEFFSVSLDDLINGVIEPAVPIWIRNIKHLRKSHNLSQDELANLIGYKGKSSISLIELSEQDISIENLVKLADYFKVSMDQMIKQDLSKATLPSANCEDDLIRRGDVINILKRVFDQNSVLWDEKNILGGFGSEVPKAIKEIPTADSIARIKR